MAALYSRRLDEITADLLELRRLDRRLRRIFANYNDADGWRLKPVIDARLAQLERNLERFALWC